MKRKFYRIFIMLLCLLIIAGGVFMQASADSVCFISVNDVLLELSVSPYSSAGIWYLPYYVYTDYGFGISYLYFDSNSSAMLYNDSRRLIFDLSAGECYDGNGNRYSARGLMRNGVVYLPLDVVRSFFGTFTSSYIEGSGYGDVIRLKDDDARLPDDGFISAAQSLMQSRYDAYFGTPAEPPQTAPPAPPAETQSPAKAGTPVRLGFAGLPDGKVLDLLSNYGYRSCFFLTADEMLSDPDLVRRLVCEGHGIGAMIYSDFDTEFGDASDVLFEIAQTRLMIVCAAQQGVEIPDVGAAPAAEFVPDLAAGTGRDVLFGGIIPVLEQGDYVSSLLLYGASDNVYSLGTVLSYLDTNRYAVSAPSETDSAR